jgi:DNA polymerase III subunit epsilon
MQFLAIDFETANPDLSSICQVGLVTFEDGVIAETYASLVNPKDYFDNINVSVHGIKEPDVENSPTFPDIYPEIARRISGKVLASHTLFDRSALNRALYHHQLPPISCQWIDTARVVRRTWPKYRNSGYGLANLAKEFGIEFNHHDAAEDARVTGIILAKALQESGLTLSECSADLLRLPKAAVGKIVPQSNPDGKLSGEFAVFTGALSMPRKDAANLAVLAGCEVESSVTKQTTLLIVGDQDVTRLAPGQEKSSKHLKAEALISKGQSIRILRESDFRALVAD